VAYCTKKFSPLVENRLLQPPFFFKTGGGPFLGPLGTQHTQPPLVGNIGKRPLNRGFSPPSQTGEIFRAALKNFHPQKFPGGKRFKPSLKVLALGAKNLAAYQYLPPPGRSKV